MPMTHLFGVGGRSLLDEVALGDAYRRRVDSLLGLIDVFDDEIEVFAAVVAEILEDIAAIRPSKPSPVSDRSWPRFSWPRSATWPASVAPTSCVRGRGSPHATASPTPMCIAGISPNKARGWCAGRRSRPWAANVAPPHRRAPSPCRRAPRPSHRPGRRGTQASHPRLLRPARRTHPLPGPGGMRPGRRSRTRARTFS